MTPLLLAASSLLSPRGLIENVGLLGIFAIVFAESGLLVGFFLPGDSLLFTAGFLASGPKQIGVPPPQPAPRADRLLRGRRRRRPGRLPLRPPRRSGTVQRPDSRVFKQANVDKATAFFDKHGAKTIVLARFVPIVRTFAPVVAGISRMHYRTFVLFNLLGGFLWAVGITLLGYFLGQVSIVADHIELAILAVVAISVLPIAVELIRSRRAGTGSSHAS